MSSDSEFELINTNGEVVEKKKKKLAKKGSKSNIVAQTEKEITANNEQRRNTVVGKENASKICEKENNPSRHNKSKTTRIKKERKNTRYSEVGFCVFAIGVVFAVALFALSNLNIHDHTQKVPESANDDEALKLNRNFGAHFENTHDLKHDTSLDEIPVEQAILGTWYPKDDLSAHIMDYWNRFPDLNYYGVLAFAPGAVQFWQEGPFLWYRTEDSRIDNRVLICFRGVEKCFVDVHRHYKQNTIVQQIIKDRDVIQKTEYFIKNCALHIKWTIGAATATREYLRTPKK
uniref:Uncharacterized protein n=1 Tax=Caenorhabditis japonica TaxID=281687 RepID=A0A8R1HQS4_CAEJA